MKKFVKEESGAAIVEYGLALLVVGSIAVGAFAFLGETTANNVNEACLSLVEGTTECAPG